MAKTRITRRAAWLTATPMIALATVGLQLSPLADHASAARVSAPTRISIAANSWSFAMPSRVPAGLVDIVVSGGQQQVDASVGRLKPGVSRARVAAAAKAGQQDALFSLLTPAGGPDGAGTAEGILSLSTGTYLVYSVDHTASGKQSVKYKFVSVGAAAGPQAEPRADVTIHERDMKFVLGGAVPAGRDTLKIVNGGPSVHETVIAKLNPGKSFKDLMAYFSQQKPSGPPPGQMLGGANAIAPHSTQWLKASFTPGHYVLICFMPDKHGQPHVMDGMYKTFTVR